MLKGKRGTWAPTRNEFGKVLMNDLTTLAQIITSINGSKNGGGTVI